MFKSIIAVALLTSAAPAVWAITPDVDAKAIEQSESEKTSKEMDEVMSIFSKMFDTSDLPEPEPARLDLAKVTASKLLPDGAYAKIMDDMIGGMLTPLFDVMPGMSDEQIAAVTGAPVDTLAALSEEQKSAITQIIDPNHKKRGQQVIDVLKPMITEAMAVIEPAMRHGLTRAYARKFTASQLATINGFFTTPTGSAFARESFALQADPEVMQATFKAFPAIISNFMGDEEKFKSKFVELPKQRELKDLSDTELQQLAQLLGVTVKSLEDQRLIASAVDPYAQETGEEPWYAEEAWAAGERKKVKALEAKYDAANNRSETASEQASSAYALYEQAWQEAVDAARQRMLNQGWTPPPAPTETSDDSIDSFEAVAAL